MNPLRQVWPGFSAFQLWWKSFNARRIIQKWWFFKLFSFKIDMSIKEIWYKVDLSTLPVILHIIVLAGIDAGFFFSWGRLISHPFSGFTSSQACHLSRDWFLKHALWVIIDSTSSWICLAKNLLFVYNLIVLVKAVEHIEVCVYFMWRSGVQFLNFILHWISSSEWQIKKRLGLFGKEQETIHKKSHVRRCYYFCYNTPLYVLDTL